MIKFEKEAMVVKVDPSESLAGVPYNYTFRLVIFEVDPDNGAKSVFDIIEQSGNSVEDIHFGEILRGDEEEIGISEAHNDVDFGRAKLLPAKIKKILRSMA